MSALVAPESFLIGFRTLGRDLGGGAFEDDGGSAGEENSPRRRETGGLSPTHCVHHGLSCVSRAAHTQASEGEGLAHVTDSVRMENPGLLTLRKPLEWS